MPFDAAVLAAVVAELDGRLRGGRVIRVHQPAPHELVIRIYAQGEQHRLLISCHPRHARLHLTRAEKPNPPAPSTFCMLLRRHLEGGRVLAVRQAGRDRVAHIQVGGRDELGNPVTHTLVAEVMGIHSNILLLGPDGRIIDAVRRVTAEANPYREVLPGLPYVPPPPTGKQDPAAVTAATLAPWTGGPAWRWVLDQIDGLSPLLARELAARAGLGDGDPEAVPAAGAEPAGARERLAAAARSLAAEWDAGRFQPCLLYGPGGDLEDVAAWPLRHWTGRQEPCPSPSAALDLLFAHREEAERARSLRAELSRVLAAELGRVRRKLSAQEAELAAAEAAEEYRLKGELLTAHLWQIRKGQEWVELPNWYDPEGAPVRIELDPALSPAENAQAYFRRYQKARAGLAAIRAQLERTRAELAYLEQVEATLAAAASLPDLEEIRRELAAEGYLSPAPGRRAGTEPAPAGRAAPAPPLTLRTSDGLEVWVGRNNRQNDYLTTRLAAPHDLWLHTREIPGAHVILRLPAGTDPPERSLLEAAAVAAWFSRARGAANVPVDYTRRKHVRKPAGARPGMVIYDHQRTVHVTPDPTAFPILARLAGADPAAE